MTVEHQTWPVSSERPDDAAAADALDLRRVVGMGLQSLDVDVPRVDVHADTLELIGDPDLRRCLSAADARDLDEI